jgi:hypothetical protein
LNSAGVEKRNSRRDDASHHDPEHQRSVPKASPVLGRIDGDFLGPRRKIRLHQPMESALVTALIACRFHSVEMP